MSTRRAYSAEQRDLVTTGLNKGWPLVEIERSEDFQRATRNHNAWIKQQQETYKKEHFLAFGSDGPFRTKEEREAAFAHPLYKTSEEFRQAVAHKAAQTSAEICGINPPPTALSPEALLRAAQLDSYNAVKESLFAKASERNPDKVEATQARQRILELAQDPNYKALMDHFDPGPEITRPLETFIKQNGPIVMQTFPTHLSEAEQQAYAIRSDNEQYSSRPGGRGDGGATGPANITFK